MSKNEPQKKENEEERRQRKEYNKGKQKQETNEAVRVCWKMLNLVSLLTSLSSSCFSFQLSLIFFFSVFHSYFI